jgi:hypothetical protein
MGSKTGGSAWSNYEMGRRPMSRKFALQLCQTFGLTLEWIYRGNPKGLPKGLQKKIRALTSAHHSAPARSSASVPAAPPPATAVRAPASGTANTDRTVDLRAVAMKLAAQLPSECHNREEALEVGRLMREQANSLYDDKPLKPRR